MSDLNNKLLEIKRQKDEYILPENLKKDVTIYGVTGTLEAGSGDIKLFDTVEHMQQDPSAQDGDLAVVYREEIQPITEDSEFDSCIFPNTVVLDEAFTDSIYGRFIAVDSSSGWFDGNVDMSSSNFRFDGFGDEMVRVEYTSQDGITYTRTDGGEELQEFGTTIKWESGGDPFNSVIGNFMKIGGNYFDGLYQYELNHIDKNYVSFNKFSPVSFSYSYDAESGPPYTLSNCIYDVYGKYSIATLVNLASLIPETLDTTFGNSYSVILGDDNYLYYFYNTTHTSGREFSPIPTYNMNFEIQNFTEYNATLLEKSHTFNIYKTNLDLTNIEFYKTLTLTRDDNILTFDKLGFNIVAEKIVIRYSINDSFPSGIISGSSLIYLNEPTTPGYGGNLFGSELYKENKYVISKTQLSANVTDLLPNKIAYSNNGVIVGNNSIYDKLNVKDYLDYKIGNLYGTTAMCYMVGLKNKLKKSSLYSGVCITCRPTGNTYISGTRIDNFIVHTDTTNKKIEVYDKQTLNLISYIDIPHQYGIAAATVQKVGSGYKFMCFGLNTSSGVSLKNYMGTIDQNGTIVLDATSSTYNQSTNFYGALAVYLSNENRWYWSYNGTIYSCLHSNNSSRTTVGSGGVTVGYRIIDNAIYSTVVSTTSPSSGDIYDNKICKISNNNVSTYLTGYGLTLNDGYVFQCIVGYKVKIYKFENGTVGTDLGTFTTTSRAFPNNSTNGYQVNMYYDETNEKLIFVSPDIVVSNKDTGDYNDGGMVYELFRDMPIYNEYAYTTPKFNFTTHQLESIGRMYDKEINIIISLEHTADDTGDIPVLMIKDNKGLLLNPYSIDNL